MTPSPKIDAHFFKSLMSAFLFVQDFENIINYNTFIDKTTTATTINHEK